MTLTARPALDGADIALGENRIRERIDLSLVSVAAPVGNEKGLAAQLKSAWNLEMPDPTRSSVAGDIRAIRTAPDQLMLIFPHPAGDENAYVQDRLDGAAYTTMQTDAWVVLEISGPDTLDALERLSMLDLAVAAFPPGAAARTAMEHMSALILRLEPMRFLLLSARSSARSFLHAVETSYRNVMP